MPKKKQFVLPPNWGVELTPNVQWIGKFVCERCGVHLNEFYDKVVGFSQVSKSSICTPRGGSLGTIIIMCPRCDKLYWAHAHLSTIIILRTEATLGKLKDYPMDKDGNPL